MTHSVEYKAQDAVASVETTYTISVNGHFEGTLVRTSPMKTGSGLNWLKGNTMTSGSAASGPRLCRIPY